MFSLRKPYYFKYFCFARFGFRQPPLGRASEGTPEPPHRAPPGPLRMLKNDEVLPFSGACHFLLSFCVPFSSCRDPPVRIFFPSVPLLPYFLPSIPAFPIPLLAFFFSRFWFPDELHRDHILLFLGTLSHFRIYFPLSFFHHCFLFSFCVPHPTGSCSQHFFRSGSKRSHRKEVLAP